MATIAPPSGTQTQNIFIRETKAAAATREHSALQLACNKCCYGCLAQSPLKHLSPNHSLLRQQRVPPTKLSSYRSLKRAHPQPHSAAPLCIPQRSSRAACV